jgi:nucleoside-diphosphate-sugar epimerase
LEGHPSFHFQKADIEDASTIARLFAAHRFEAVLDLAARAGVRANLIDPHIYLTTNTQGALNLLELMARHKVGRYLMASTSSLYAGRVMPLVETTDVTRPISPYAGTKLAAEALAYIWHHLHGIDGAILTYFKVNGPTGRPDMSPFRFIVGIRRGQPITLYGDGLQTRLSPMLTTSPRARSLPWRPRDIKSLISAEEIARWASIP